MLNATHDRRPPTRRALAITSASLLALTVAASAARISGQTSPLPVTGQVYDASGALLPQVALTIEGDGVEWQATTDAAGRFEFPLTAAGKYTLSASLAGFRPLRYELVLQHPRDWQRAITLQVGTVRESIVVTDRRRPGRTAVVAPGPHPLRVGGNIRAPLKTVDIKPIYPESMRDLGLEGTVPIDAVIGTDGAVASVRVVSAQVHPDLAIAAIDAVRQWRFTPTLLNGKPVEIVMTVTVQFSLTE
jgi:protein TonB